MPRNLPHSARLAALLATLTVTPGCGLKRYLPKKAVLDAQELAPFTRPAPSGVAYTGPARAPVPVLPVQVFGLFYDLDIVLVSTHDAWDMHEYARVDLPDGSLWLAKDSRAGTLVQGIVADVPDIDTWMPEAAVPRQQGQVQVTDRGEGRKIDLSLSYTNMDGAPVEVEVRGKLPRKPPGKRNGSTMGHSQQSAAVLLDLQRFGSAARARMSIGGEKVPIKRLLGLQPFRFLLQQAQGGIMVASMVQRPGEAGLDVTRPAPGAIDPATGQPGWPTRSEEHWTVDPGSDDTRGETVLARQGRGGTLRYFFRDGELVRAEAWQHGRDIPVTVLRFAPALPDLRRPFTGTHESHFAIEVNGQQGHGTGTLAVSWTDADTVRLALRPTAPWWVADRPMGGTLAWQDDGSAVLDLHRVPDATAPASTVEDGG